MSKYMLSMLEKLCKVVLWAHYLFLCGVLLGANVLPLFAKVRGPLLVILCLAE